MEYTTFAGILVVVVAVYNFVILSVHKAYSVHNQLMDDIVQELKDVDETHNEQLIKDIDQSMYLRY